jgi:hypothetical protein
VRAVTVVFLPLCVGLTPILLQSSPRLSTAWATAFGVAVWFLVHVTRELSDGLQAKLRVQWDGRPAVRMMRHRNGSGGDIERRARHERYSSRLATPFPNDAEEHTHPYEADAIYAAAVQWIESRTRDRMDLSQLRRARAEYHFLLNCLALRWIGIAFATAMTLWSCLESTQLSLGVQSDWALQAVTNVNAGSLPTFAASALMMAFWIGFATPEKVRATAQFYDECLLECGDAPDLR